MNGIIITCSLTQTSVYTSTHSCKPRLTSSSRYSSYVESMQWLCPDYKKPLLKFSRSEAIHRTREKCVMPVCPLKMTLSSKHIAMFASRLTAKLLLRHQKVRVPSLFKACPESLTLIPLPRI